jgi:hypothetical protein
MNNLANTQSELGRHQDALLMKEKTLEFRRRVLPENHPDIGAAIFAVGFLFRRTLMLSVLGSAMGNLANTYSDLGRHQDALVMEEKTLEFLRRALPENHPDLGGSNI